MKQVKFGEMNGQIQDSREEMLDKFLNKSKEKKEKKEKKIKKEENYKYEKFDTCAQNTFRCGQVEAELLQLMLNSEEAKDCRISKSYLFCKAIHIFFFEFINDEKLFFEKLISAEKFKEREEPLKEEEIEE
jgi:hypothetical protein